MQNVFDVILNPSSCCIEDHWMILAVKVSIPPSPAVRSMVLETERLVESRRLLEAHARLMDLEQWQDDILWQLHGTAGTARSPLSAEDQELVTKYFSGVGKLVDALGERMDGCARCAHW